MNLLYLSQSIGQLVCALNIEHNQDTNFTQWLACLCELSNAKHATLECLTTAERWSYNECMTSDFRSECVFEFDQYQFIIVLHYDSATVYEQYSSTLVTLRDTIQTCLKLGITNHNAHAIKNIKYSSLNALNLGLVNINQKGHIIDCNEFAQSLFQTHQLSNVNQQLVLGGTPITQYFSVAETEYFQWHCQQSHFFSCLNNTKNENANWILSDTVYKLIIQPLCFSPSPKWLMKIYPFTESQAMVASYACSGLSAKDISRLTKFSSNTVYSYLKNIYNLLNINNQSQLASAIWPNIPV